MRVFTFISKSGDALPLAQRIVDEGHRVIFYINDKDARLVGDRMIEKSNVKGVLVDDNGTINREILIQVLYPKPDCIIFDMVGKGFGKVADTLRAKGFAVIGGSQWADRVELDRLYGAKIMKIAGIGIPRTYAFNNYPEAIRFVEEKNKAYVYKPSGNKPTTTTFVSRNADDMIGMLEYYSNEVGEFELQEKVDGVEISTELWFNGSDVVNVNHTMEEKSLMPSGGPKSGCMGDVVWNGSTNSRLYQEGIGKMIATLKKISYKGPIDLNTIITKDRLYGLEFCPRFGYNALFSFLMIYRGKINDLLYSIATGVAKNLPINKGWGLSVTFALPPFPLDIEPDYSKDILIQGVNEQNKKYIWFYDVYKKGKDYACSGNGGDLGAVTAYGDTIREAKRRAYRTLNNLVIPDVIYREDIGNRVSNDIATLKQWKWL